MVEEKELMEFISAQKTKISRLESMNSSLAAAVEAENADSHEAALQQVTLQNKILKAEAAKQNEKIGELS
jgi:hypothetical protein